MARTIEEIKESILTAKDNEPSLSTLNSTRMTAIWRLFVYIVAVAHWTLENLFDAHKVDIDQKIASLKPHTPRWYRDKALRFQIGQSLVPDADFYDNTGKTQEQINDLEVVKQAAAVEQENDSGRILRIKIAGGISQLEPLSETTCIGVEAYFNMIKDAGVLLQVTSDEADKLYGALLIHYNPTVFNAQGEPLFADETSITVSTAINNYLQNLTFNGEFSIMRLVDALQNIDGVELVHHTELHGQYANISTQINDRYIPDSGYMRVMEYTNISATQPYTINSNKLVIRYAPYL